MGDFQPRDSYKQNSHKKETVYFKEFVSGEYHMYHQLIPLHSTKFQLFPNSWVKRKSLNLFIHHSNTRGEDKNTVFIVVELRSILHSSKIVSFQVDWLTGLSTMKYWSTFKTLILCQLPDIHSFQGYW